MPQPPELRHLVPVPTGASALPAADVTGWDLTTRPRRLCVRAPGQWTLLVFLGSRCDGCLPFWPAAGAPQELGLEQGGTAVIVTRGPADEDAAALVSLMGNAPPATGVHRADAGDYQEQERTPGLLMSDDAWTTYRVHGAPFFVLLDGESVVTEGVAWSVEQVAADVARARRRVPR